MSYRPNPVDTSDVVLPEKLAALSEKLAWNVHEQWAKNRQAEGWTYGPRRNDALKQTPCMVPFDQLPEEEKNIDRTTAMETIKLILKLGYLIE